MKDEVKFERNHGLPCQLYVHADYAVAVPDCMLQYMTMRDYSDKFPVLPTLSHN